MRTLVMSAALLAMLSAEALAQSTTPTAPSAGGAPAGVPAGVPMDQNSAGTVGNRFDPSVTGGQDQMRKTLEQAGFTNIRVLDSAYLVQAQTANGETVMMMIDSAMPMASGSSGTAPGTMMRGGMLGAPPMGFGSGDGSSSSNSGATTGKGPGGSMGTGTGTTTK